jgi:hypothetical protein
MSMARQRWQQRDAAAGAYPAKKSGTDSSDKGV